MENEQGVFERNIHAFQDDEVFALNKGMVSIQQAWYH